MEEEQKPQRNGKTVVAPPDQIKRTRVWIDEDGNEVSSPIPEGRNV